MEKDYPSDEYTAAGTTARPPLIEQIQFNLRQIELTLTEATLKLNTDPQNATVMLATLVKDFRQTTGMLNEVCVNAKMTDEHMRALLKEVRGSFDSHTSQMHAHLAAIGMNHG